MCLPRLQPTTSGPTTSPRCRCSPPHTRSASRRCSRGHSGRTRQRRSHRTPSRSGSRSGTAWCLSFGCAAGIVARCHRLPTEGLSGHYTRVAEAPREGSRPRGGPRQVQTPVDVLGIVHEAGPDVTGQGQGGEGDGGEQRATHARTGPGEGSGAPDAPARRALRRAVPVLGGRRSRLDSRRTHRRRRNGARRHSSA